MGSEEYEKKLIEFEAERRKFNLAPKWVCNNKKR
jgi:hypothetical protein